MLQSKGATVVVVEHPICTFLQHQERFGVDQSFWTPKWQSYGMQEETPSEQQ
jgi:hypothetical protein